MLQPLRGKILVQVLHDSNMTAGGLYLPDNKEEVPHRGKVISIGSPFLDRKGRALAWGIQEGHIVHFIRVWDQKKVAHYIIKRDQIFAVEHEGKAYGFGEMIIVKRHYTGRIGDSTLIIPKGFGVESNLEEFYGDVVSVGREDKLGVSVGDRIIFHRNEGLLVKIPFQDEMWSLKPRAVLAKIS